MGACQNDTCREASRNIRLQVVNAISGQIDTLAFSRIIPQEAPLDTLLYQQEDTLSTFVLPLAPSRAQVSFRFDFLLSSGSTRSDSLTLSYTREQVFEGKNCGLQIKLSDLRVVAHSFDSVQVVNNQIDDNEDFINLYIYP